VKKDRKTEIKKRTIRKKDRDLHVYGQGQAEKINRNFEKSNLRGKQ
jgi:hypothetical protein